jgi:hypothetical protein
MQLFQFVSAYFYFFVSYFTIPSWWPKCNIHYINVMPKIFFVFYVLGDFIVIPVTEWVLIGRHWEKITSSGIAHYYQLCGLMQLAFVILFLYQLRG